MKRLLLVMAFIVSAIGAVCHANEVTFVAGSDVCTPITVYVGGKSYKVYSSYTVSGVSGSVSATDCNGNKLKYDYGHRYDNGKSYDTYTFHNTYNASRSSGNSSSSGSYSGSYNSDAYNSGARLGSGVGSLIFGLGGGADGEAYPSLAALPGVSYAYGENLKLRYTGYGFHIYASIGKDWLFKNEYQKKILWNAGMGSYFAFGGDGDPNMDVSLGLSVGQLSTFEKLSMMIDIDYVYWIGRWRRIGLFAGAGLGCGSFVELFNVDDVYAKPGFAWNVEAGITIRIANF
ncbi:MAG: hypothetical protein K2L89_05820 [Muribaculaceae bacterium]|nr:hypothetical protein [Muribaculaceae bacterium]